MKVKIPKIKIPLGILFSDLFLPFIKRNIQKISLLLFLIFIGIFFTIYFTKKQSAKHEDLLKIYLSAVTELSQKEEEKALKKFEKVYNSSSGMLEILSLIQVVDITITKEQYEAFPKLLEEILSINTDGETSLTLYSKAITILAITEEKNILAPEKQEKFTKDFATKIRNLKISKEFLANKNTLLIAINERIDAEIDTKVGKSELTNELVLAVNLINGNIPSDAKKNPEEYQ